KDTFSYFFPPDREPHEPNITALLDPENVKWKHLLSPGIKIPTKWGKEEIEELQIERQDISRKMNSEISKLKNKGASEQELENIRRKFGEKIKKINEKINQVRDKYRSELEGKIGVFEGAGYTSKGIYRSEFNIGMFNGKKNSYGPVSEEAILKIINHLSN
ncbi:hypothetical protein DRQ09_03045, partial [candidate division KSB1 bacterium]